MRMHARITTVCMRICSLSKLHSYRCSVSTEMESYNGYIDGQVSVVKFSWYNHCCIPAYHMGLRYADSLIRSAKLSVNVSVQVIRT